MMYLINTKFFYMFLSPMLFLTTILTPELTGSLSAQLVAQKEKKTIKKVENIILYFLALCSLLLFLSQRRSRRRRD